MNRKGEYSRVCQFPFHDIALDLLSSLNDEVLQGVKTGLQDDTETNWKWFPFRNEFVT